MKKISLAIVDDLGVDQALLTWHIKGNKQFDILFYATNGHDLLYKLQHQQPDIIILDIYMPLMDGWETLDYLKKHQYKGLVLAVSNGHDPDLIEKLKAKGANGFCRKNGVYVLKALETISRSGKFWDLEHFTGMQKTDTPFPMIFNHDISGIEIELINMLSMGLNCEEISSKIGCYTASTIETYIHNIIHRFNLKNRAHLVAFSYVNGLLYNMNEFQHLPKPNRNMNKGKINV
jgi:DNA-binding NarL/FixJ family response regulator